MGAQPLFVLSEDSTRSSGRDARQQNITAGKAVAESVRTTLGPQGMDKMLVADDEVVITNDGATILDEMDIEHPAADMIVEVAETQEEEVGDGTTTAAILTGQLLAQAEDLFEDDVHPTTIVEGYHKAAEIAAEAVDELTLDTELDKETLKKVAESSMTGKGTGGVTADRLADFVVSAIQRVRDGDTVHRDLLSLQTQAGASSAATEIVNGITLDEEPLNANLTVEDFKAPKVVVLDVELGVRSSDVDAEYSVENVDQLNRAMESEQQELQEYVDYLANETSADVVFTTEDVDDRIANALERERILVYEDISDDDAAAIANATGATRVGDFEDLTTEDQGTVNRLRTETYDDEEVTFIKGHDASQAVTLFIRGGTEHVVDELERAVEDAVDVLTAAIESGSVVPGAGAAEIAIADRIRGEAASIEGRKQLSVEAFADAVDAIPRTLAENSGADPIDTLVELRALHDEEGRAGLVGSGRNAEIDDPVEDGILDPAAVKNEAVRSATEASTMVVRIDDVISAN
jgi:thermosome